MEKPWYQHYDYFVPQTIRYPKIPVHYMLDLAASKYKDAPATDFYGAVMSYRELKAHVNKLAIALTELGIQKGDRVGLMLPNCPQIAITSPPFKALPIFRPSSMVSDGEFKIMSKFIINNQKSYNFLQFHFHYIS